MMTDQQKLLFESYERGCLESDRIIIAIASGGLFLSVNLLNKLNDVLVVDCLFILLKISSGFFTLAIVSVLVSYQLSNKLAYDKLRDTNSHLQSSISKAIDIANVISSLLLIFGLFVFCSWFLIFT